VGENEAHGTLSYTSLSRILFPEHAEESHNCLIISSQTVALPDGFAAARVITSCPYHKYSTLHLIALYMKMHYIHLSILTLWILLWLGPFTGPVIWRWVLGLGVIWQSCYTSIFFKTVEGVLCHHVYISEVCLKGKMCARRQALLTSNYVAFCGRLPLATSISFLSPDGAQGMWADYGMGRGFLSGSTDKLINHPCSQIKPLRVWPVILY